MKLTIDGQSVEVLAKEAGSQIYTLANGAIVRLENSLTTEDHAVTEWIKKEEVVLEGDLKVVEEEASNTVTTLATDIEKDVTDTVASIEASADFDANSFISRAESELKKVGGEIADEAKKIEAKVEGLFKKK